MSPIHASRLALLTLIFSCAAAGRADTGANLVHNGDFTQRSASNQPVGYHLSGDAEYRYLGDPSRDVSGWGVAMRSARPGSSGSVSQTICGIDPKEGRWFRFTFRGLPEEGFALTGDDLSMNVEFLGQGGKIAYDGKSRKIYPLVQQYRRDFTVNGDRHVGGAEVWRTYELDFWLPFPQVDTVRLGVEFSGGAGRDSRSSNFFVTGFSVVRISGSAENQTVSAKSASAIEPQGKLIPLGGRWFYEARDGETAAPRLFNHANTDRLRYHDAIWSAPFVGNMTAWLHAGNLDRSGNIVSQDRLVADNVTIEFDANDLILHTHGLPNHPTGKYPSDDFANGGNPNYIQDRLRTYFIPLNPKENPRHFSTTTSNSNHALSMGPIGVAINGVVFFNPFDAGNSDASNMMDRCCGHPAPDNMYHYHKYPICLNSPWADEGAGHSPLIGFAFDGFPIYGPYESANVMAKDVKGEGALNEFNMHYDPQRGWHYHVTPGKFPYIIGGYWGTEDPKDKQMGRRGRGFGPPPGGRGFGPPQSE